MKIGVPKEIKPQESRVGATPETVSQLVHAGHEVFVETNAGAGIGVKDDAYVAAGAKILSTADEVFATAEMIVKVKEPQLVECEKLKPHHILFTYLHLAPDPEQAKALMKSGCTAIAYETVVGKDGGLPLLAPMSEVAGRMASQVGAHCLLKPQGGLGRLMGGVPGVAPAKVVVLGAGVAGTNAAQIAKGMHADVTVFDRSKAALVRIDNLFNGAVKTMMSSPSAVEAAVLEADLVIGAVLIPGASAPKLVTKAMLPKMKDGAVLVDISIDQGGCFETSKPTTHYDPTYVIDGVVHYCVANMPGAAPLTSTYALNAVTAPYMLELANKGVDQALADDAGFALGLNVKGGKIVNDAVIEALKAYGM
ncbi:alanine dehydrogenase [Pseudaquidulcibacter saccharophilus]|uniref:alanine dehydrogenase n=1 Tax=Pseudaquidulcibacter saccharophilus TaxID=2831900 RepID=UPI001EFF06E0|nr:alanine dehydrogenase [Pseudaquidulcibacter saccharophilus]